MITDFRDKPLADYLQPGQRVLIRFGHGLGDTIMFMPLLDLLRYEYLRTQIDLYVECGQEAIWGSVPDKDAEGYDQVFSLDFPMCEGELGLTKAQKCARDELGISSADDPFCELDVQPSPLVGCHFQGTALPGSVSWPEAEAQQIWEEVRAFGKVPIECHMQHVFHNPVNAPYWCVGSRNLRDCQASLPTLIGLIQRCWAFIGVASGPWVVAMSMMPERCLFLERGHKASSYTTEPVSKLTLDTFEAGQVTTWLSMLSS